MIKVLIVDDQELICESLEIMLNNKRGIEVVGIAHNGHDAAALAAKHVPHVVLMDVRMPIMDGVQSLSLIKKANPDIKVIVLTTFDDDDYVYDALKNGASGYLLKNISGETLIEAILTVADGGALINPGVASKFLKLFSEMARSDFRAREGRGCRHPDLADKEMEIIRLIGRGLSNKEINDRLNLNPGTVRNYVSNILKKLDLRDRTQIAIFAVQSGLME
jgi:DNA-binding NarL/FixJ family response regulator